MLFSLSICFVTSNPFSDRRNHDLAGKSMLTAFSDKSHYKQTRPTFASRLVRQGNRAKHRSYRDYHWTNRMAISGTTHGSDCKCHQTNRTTIKWHNIWIILRVPVNQQNDIEMARLMDHASSVIERAERQWSAKKNQTNHSFLNEEDKKRSGDKWKKCRSNIWTVVILKPIALETCATT